MTHSKTAASKRANLLQHEKSPYLLQHQFNPVDWHPWGEPAFQKARVENKPIFLSIGYSTCHWCHVMERESFESERVAAFLNEHYVSIKVDREERPDVDKIYMTFVQATTGQGGWPLSAFLLPDLRPFFGGTYFPPDNRHGRPGFLQLLTNIIELWKTKRDDLTDSAAQMHTRLGEAMAASAAAQETPPAISESAIKKAGELFKSHYDPRHGGFGGAPKFPQPSQPQLLLRYAARFHDAEAVNMVIHSCERMAAGGIHDQLGGGFARYSVDAEWLVPHFEKMLYDNAQLVQLYLDAWLVSGNQRFADTARGILDYVRRDMTHPEGGFFSAEDADSEGQEGKFYCWTTGELSRLLTPEEYNVATSYFGVTEQGNFVDHSHPNPLPNLNVLSIKDPNMWPGDEALLASAKRKMIEARSHRVRPGLDDKVLASWNGLMLGAFARAYAVLQDDSFLIAACRNARFLKEKLWDDTAQTLYHRWREGERDQVELLDGYAFLLSGVIELYEATLEGEHLEFAVQLASAMLRKFFDAEHGGFWQSIANAPDLIFRVKEDYDGAEPSGNSVATLALLKLSAITERQDFADAAAKTLSLYSTRLGELPQSLPYMLQAVDFSLQAPRRALIPGDPSDPALREILHAVHAVYQPNKTVLGTCGPVEPFARECAGKPPMLYLCTGPQCQPPVREVTEIKNRMQATIKAPA